jgi:hypothetical protein
VFDQRVCKFWKIFAKESFPIVFLLPVLYIEYVKNIKVLKYLFKNGHWSNAGTCKLDKLVPRDLRNGVLYRISGEKAK